ncbi:MAG: hypothetical protein HY042_04360 [Spirochaetia bacterium]|nr:hypothetical protein [Spirochaetia bacterium]
MKMKLFEHKWKIVVGVLTALVLAAAFLLWAGHRGGKGRLALELEDRLRAKNVEEAAAAGLRSLSLANMNRLIEQSEQATPRLMMAQYLLYYRYPADSRPLSKQMKDLLDPYSVAPVEHAAIEAAGPKRGERSEYVYSWSGPTYLVTGKTPAVAYLSVKDTRSGAAVPISVLSADVLSDARFGTIKIADASYSDDGAGNDKKADDKTYTFTWTPRPGQKSDWGEIALTVKFKTPDGKSFEVTTGFNSTPDPPAVFTGEYRERLDQGSLYIGVEIDVRKPGKYIIEANLFADSDPMHWVYINRYLEAGKQFVDLPFFGLVFHDKDFSGGRLTLRELRGHRLNLPFDPRRLDAMLERGESVPVTTEPFQEWITPSMKTYTTTKSYSITDFSEKEYEGPDKENRLKLVRDYARDWEEAHGASDDTKLD